MLSLLTHPLLPCWPLPYRCVTAARPAPSTPGSTAGTRGRARCCAGWRRQNLKAGASACNPQPHAALSCIPSCMAARCEPLGTALLSLVFRLPVRRRRVSCVVDCCGLLLIAFTVMQHSAQLRALRATKGAAVDLQAAASRLPAPHSGRSTRTTLSSRVPACTSAARRPEARGADAGRTALLLLTALPAKHAAGCRCRLPRRGCSCTSVEQRRR